MTVREHASLEGVVSSEVRPLRTDQRALITRERFADVPTPTWFQASISDINHAGTPEADVVCARTHLSAAASPRVNAAAPDTQRRWNRGGTTTGFRMCNTSIRRHARIQDAAWILERTRARIAARAGGTMRIDGTTFAYLPDVHHRHADPRIHTPTHRCT